MALDAFFLRLRRPPRSPLFPYTTLCRCVSDQIVRRHRREGTNVSLEDYIAQAGRGVPLGRMGRPEEFARDRKSTRLNSTHANISYAVICLNKTTKSIEDLDHSAQVIAIY